MGRSLTSPQPEMVSSVETAPEGIKSFSRQAHPSTPTGARILWGYHGEPLTSWRRFVPP